jgi:hypothetical protein
MPCAQNDELLKPNVGCAGPCSDTGGSPTYETLYVGLMFRFI